MVGAQSMERKGSNFAAQRSGAVVLQAQRAKHIQSKNVAIAIWLQFYPMNYKITFGNFPVSSESLEEVYEARAHKPHPAQSRDDVLRRGHPHITSTNTLDLWTPSPLAPTKFTQPWFLSSRVGNSSTVNR